MRKELLMALWDRFDTSDAAELVYEEEDSRLVLKRPEAGPIFGQVPEAAVSSGTCTRRTGTAAVGRQVGRAEAAAGGKTSDLSDGPDRGHASGKASSFGIKAPMAGTFYRAASPEAEPFVRIGQTLHAGDTVAIIEAMKMMNEITADRDGIVTEISAEDGQVVGFEEILFRLDPVGE